MQILDIVTRPQVEKIPLLQNSEMDITRLRRVIEGRLEERSASGTDFDYDLKNTGLWQVFKVARVIERYRNQELSQSQPTTEDHV